MKLIFILLVLVFVSLPGFCVSEILNYSFRRDFNIGNLSFQIEHEHDKTINLIDEKQQQSWRSRSSSNSAAFSGVYFEWIRKSKVETLNFIEKMTNLFHLVADLIHDLTIVLWEFDDDFIKFIEDTIKAYELISAEKYASMLQKMRTVTRTANGLKVQTKKFFMRIKSNWSKHRLNRLMEKFSDEMDATSHEQMIKVFDDLTTFTEASRAKLSTAFAELKDDLLPILEASKAVKEGALKIVKQIRLNIYMTLQIEQQIESVNAKLDEKILIEFIDAKSVRSAKLHAHKLAINDILDELHRSWEYIPEQLDEYANERPRILFNNQLQPIDPTDILAVAYHLTAERTTINNIRTSIENVSKSQWLGDLDEFFGIIFSILYTSKVEMGAFNSIAVDHIKTILNSNEMIKEKTVVHDFIKELSEFIGKCSQPIIRLGSKLITKYTEELLHPNKPRIRRTSPTKSSKLSGVIEGFKWGMIDLEDEIKSEVIPITMNLVNFDQETIVIRTLLAEIKYVITNVETDNEYKWQKVQQLIEKIRPKLVNAADLFELHKNFIKAKKEKLSLLIDVVHAKQIDLLTTLKSRFGDRIGNLPTCNPC